MKIKFHKISELDKNLKATIHKTGKLGFTVEAAEKLKLDVSKSVQIGTNEADLTDENLYLLVNDDIIEDSFKINKAGIYYSINAKILFDNLKIDYQSENVVYDIEEIVIDEAKVFKLKKRPSKPKSEEPGITESN